MDSSLISGPVMSLIGITTVFVVLVCLVGVVAVMRRWFEGREATAEAAGPAFTSATASVTASDLAPDTSSAAEADSDDPLVEDLLTVALATYAYHRSSRAIPAPRPQATEWSNAGRVRQIATFRR